MQGDSIPKGPRHHSPYPRLPVTVSRYRGPADYQRALRIVPKFLPPGYRFLRPREQVLSTDFYWSKRNKCYLPVKGKIGGWAGLAGEVLPFIRSSDEG